MEKKDPKMKTMEYKHKPPYKKMKPKPMPKNPKMPDKKMKPKPMPKLPPGIMDKHPFKTLPKEIRDKIKRKIKEFKEDKYETLKGRKGYKDV